MTIIIRIADTVCGWCGDPIAADTQPTFLTLAGHGGYRHRLLEPGRRRVEVEGELVRRAYCCKDHALAHAEQVAEYETYHQGQPE